MKIITEKEQDEALVHLSKVNDALMSEDEIKRIEAIAHTAELAYIIGGVRLMHRVRTESFEKEGKHE